MSDYWLGLITIPIGVVVVAAALAVSALLLDVFFEKGTHLLRLLPVPFNRNNRRAAHAGVMATADRGARLFWIAGIGVYVVAHAPFSSHRRTLLHEITNEVENRLDAADRDDAA